MSRAGGGGEWGKREGRRGGEKKGGKMWLRIMWVKRKRDRGGEGMNTIGKRKKLAEINGVDLRFQEGEEGNS